MSQTHVRMAFPSSEALDESFRRFRDAVEQDPQGDHQALLRPLSDHFVDEVLGAFFEGPIQAVGEQGRNIDLIRRVMGAIGKAARGLAHRLMKHASPEEQQALARHFEALRLEQDGRVYVSFPLDDALANRMFHAFDEFIEHNEGDMGRLVDVMKRMSEKSVEYFLDRTVEHLNLGAFNRGLVRTARATILKSSSMACSRALPDMEYSHRRPVLGYFREMLIEVTE